MKSRLKELMEEFGLKQSDFEQYGINRIIVSNLILEKTDFKDRHIITFCDVLQVEPFYLLAVSNDGIHVRVLDKTYSLSREKYLLYKDKISIVNGRRTLNVNSLDEIETIDCNAQLIKLKNEIM